MRSAIIVVLALLIYAWLLVGRFSPEPAGSDGSGYLNSASMLTKGRFTYDLRTPYGIENPYPYHFEPLGLHFNQKSKQLTSTYFLGLPLHLAIAGNIVGLNHSPYVIIIGSALLTLLVTALISIELGVSSIVAFAAAASLAICPVFILTSTCILSDTLATFWCSFAFLAAIKARRGKLAWALATGCAVGLAILVRSTNALMILPVIVALRDWRALAYAAVGGMPVIGFLLYYQASVYGSPWQSGYGDFGATFSVAVFFPTIAFFYHYFMLLLPFSLLSFFALFHPPALKTAKEVAALAAWVGAFVVFYAFYSPVHQHWSNLRFVEPAFPALLVMASMGIEDFAARFLPDRIRAFGASFSAVAAALAGVATVQLFSHFPNPKLRDLGCVQSGEWITAQLPRDAVVLSMLYSGMIYFKSDQPIMRWDLLSKTDANGYFRDLKQAGGPVYALLDTHEISDPRIGNIPGKWTKLANFSSASIWRIIPK
jgi:hypothetical protein